MINRKQRYVSDELHHFVARRFIDSPDRGYEVLVKILKDGQVSRPNPDDQSSDVIVRGSFKGSLLDETFSVPAATCFCDIPPDEISLHVEKYGPFGLSFRKKHLVSCGARPVMYRRISQIHQRPPPPTYKIYIGLRG